MRACRAHRDEEIDGDEQGGGRLEQQPVVEGSQPQLANAESAASLARLLLFVPLVGSKGGIDGGDPLIPLGYASRLQVIWLWRKGCL